MLGSIEVLQGHGSSDTRELVVTQCVPLLVQSGLAANNYEAERMVVDVLGNGKALDFFKQMCISQGVDGRIAELLVKNPKEVLKFADNATRFKATESGYVGSINSMTFAEMARKHGAGRFSIEDEIIPEIGFEILIEHGQKIAKGHDWLVFHHNELITEDDLFKLTNSLEIANQKPEQTTRLISVIS